MSFNTCVIANPVSGNGCVEDLWPSLQPRLEEATSSLTVRWTTGPRSATPLTQEALHEGYDRIVALGGDGTLHEVVNGFFENDQPIAPSAVLAHIACGSGTDFRRTLNAPIELEGVQQLKSSRIRPLDLIRLEYQTPSGEWDHCYMINIAAFGLSSTVAEKVSESRSFPLPPFLRYLTSALFALASHHPVSVQLTLDDQPLGEMKMHLAAIANGHTFGAGICIAPSAVPTDGQLDVTVVHDMSIFSLLRHVPSLYWGTHTQKKGVSTYRGRRLTVTPCQSEPIPLDADGELRGVLPATAEIVPDAIRVQY